MSELYRDFIDRKADEIITDLGGTITPAPANAELYRDFLDRKFDDVINALPSGPSSEHHYSTSEQVVGTWIDGSTLYECTIEYLHTTQEVQTVSLPTGVVWSNIKNIVATVKNDTDVQSTYIFDSTNRFSVRANSTDGIIVTIGSRYPAVPATVTITIRYTKNTD